MIIVFANISELSFLFKKKIHKKINFSHYLLKILYFCKLEELLNETKCNY